MMKKMFLLALLTLSQVGFAALPPLFEGVREIQAILADPQLGTLLSSGEVIEQIVKNSTGFSIITNKSYLRVNVEYLPQGRPGPAKFSLSFQTPVAIDTPPAKPSL